MNRSAWTAVSTRPAPSRIHRASRYSSISSGSGGRGGMPHYLRNPLNPRLGCLAILINMSVVSQDRSYRALLGAPSVGRMLIGMQIARIGQSMVSIAIVLFALDAYRSAAIAGMATFFAVFPGLLVSPVAGALLDRHGRTRLVILDYLVALLSLILLGVLALAQALPAWLLMVIAAVASLTVPLSGSGLRSLLPILVPVHLWERANALDSTGFLIATIVGPPLAAGIVALWGGPIAFIAIGLTFGA